MLFSSIASRFGAGLGLGSYAAAGAHLDAPAAQRAFTKVWQLRGCPTVCRFTSPQVQGAVHPVGCPQAGRAGTAGCGPAGRWTSGAAH
ncbi:hypothetical protein [Streptomyces sp. NPDC090798]|uniref:hypothetical protein n=1 Tax=Streptomyces sp. NPDC090798 TaxID=3365968 RepID=UPI0038142E75